MLDALADVSLMLLVSQRRTAFAHRVEVIDTNHAVVDVLLQHIEVFLLAVGYEFDDEHLVAEMVEHHHIFI